MMTGYFDVLRDEIEPLVPENPSLVMDVGCGTGATSRWLKQIRQNVITVGVEIDQRMAAIAATVVDEIVITDLNHGLEQLEPYTGRVDLLLLLDILEHLRDPWTRLKEFKSLLSPTGVMIASIPNVRNFKVLLPLLLKGEWRYQDAGILDKTHLRFFTRRTILELFHGAGLEIQAIALTGPTRRARVKSISGWVAFVANILLAGALKDFLVHQYVVRGAAPSGPGTQASDDAK